MSENTNIKKIIFYVLLLVLLFCLLSKSHESGTKIPVISHSLTIETYPLETETETQTETQTETIPETTEPPPPPAEILLEDIPYYSQEGLLPTGCEIVSAKMVLDYYVKHETDIHDLINLLNCQYPQEIDGHTYAPHPKDAFIGIPEESSGFGCFSPIIVKALNQLLPKQYQAVDLSGSELSEIAETYLPQGKPVLVWATIEMWETRNYLGWYLLDENGNPTDTWYDWQVNEHCMVLVGYDEQYYYFNDPYGSNGLIHFERPVVEDRYEQIGKYAAVVTEKQDTTK
ncbi:MAG: C39 family peptidase [Oscillospiraceae bacterium]|nr:C39 family peptidase [Oscillospiraceae bacterium]